MTIEERLARLEKGHRCWKRLAIVLVSVLGAVLLVGQAKPDVHDELVARTLRLVDAEGFTWLIGGPIKGAERLQIRQKGGPAVVQLSARNQGAGLVVWDDRPSVVSVTRTWEGKAMIHLAGSKRSGVSLGHGDDFLGVRVYDEHAKAVWQAPR